MQKYRQPQQDQRISVVIALPPAMPDAEEKRHDQDRAEERERRHVMAGVRIPGDEEHAEGLEDVAG